MRMLHYFLSRPWRNTSATHNTQRSLLHPHTQTHNILPYPPRTTLLYLGPLGCITQTECSVFSTRMKCRLAQFICRVSYKTHSRHHCALKVIRDKVTANTRSILVSSNVHSEQRGVWHWSLSHERACWIRQLRVKLCQHFKILVRMEAHKVDSRILDSWFSLKNSTILRLSKVLSNKNQWAIQGWSFAHLHDTQSCKCMQSTSHCFPSFMQSPFCLVGNHLAQECTGSFNPLHCLCITSQKTIHHQHAYSFWKTCRIIQDMANTIITSV